MLSVLTREEQLIEMDLGAALLREITGIRPHFVAYPYGSEGDYDADSFVAARAAGFDAGFVNHWAPFDTELYRYRIPRFYVAPLPADGFRSWLQGVINL
jgi:peptidoglycan/xylan/chitin deacetylase (PgdA/CDA1 family)